MNRLIITNGSSAVKAILRANIDAELLSWDDVLHDGPVPGSLSLSELSNVRSDYLASCGWGRATDIRNRFVARDAVLASAGERGEVVCWLEHDLYDILQMWQILSLLSQMSIKVSLICHPLFVSQQPPSVLQEHFESRTTVSPTMFNAAEQLWSAFRAGSPHALFSLRYPSDLPFTSETINRWCEMFPSATNGLSRVEEFTLQFLSQHNDGCSFGTLFKAVSDQEEAVFMGDGSFEKTLKRLSVYKQPLVVLDYGSDDKHGPVCHLTEAGKQRLVLEKWEWDAASDRWLGGVHLTGETAWVFNRSVQKFAIQR